MMYQGVEMNGGEVALDMVDQAFHAFHHRSNAFWDGVPEPVPVTGEEEEFPEIEPWDTDPHGITGDLSVRCRKCGMAIGVGCRAANGNPCGAHKERREDAAASRAVG